jgi:SAM-dependent methyltransferase
MPVCKCCNSQASFIGALDFNRTCMDKQTQGGRVFPLSAEMVPYYLCGNCGFVFTDYCDSWSPDDFKNRIYNGDYWKADFDVNQGSGVENTAAYANGKVIASFFDGSQKSIRLLDFGSGGNPGRMGQALIDSGFDLTSYDPYLCDYNAPVTGKYDVICAIEVFEHCHNLAETAEFVSTHLSDGGLVYLSTLLRADTGIGNPLDSWYIAPRNGHISIFSLKALSLLFRRFGVNIVVTMFGPVGFKKNIPQFANRIFV